MGGLKAYRWQSILPTFIAGPKPLARLHDAAQWPNSPEMLCVRLAEIGQSHVRLKLSARVYSCSFCPEKKPRRSTAIRDVRSVG